MRRGEVGLVFLLVAFLSWLLSMMVQPHVTWGDPPPVHGGARDFVLLSSAISLTCLLISAYAVVLEKDCVGLDGGILSFFVALLLFLAVYRAGAILSMRSSSCSGNSVEPVLGSTTCAPCRHATPADAQLATVLGKIRTALDDAMERGIWGVNQADAAARGGSARAQDYNLGVIEKALDDKARWRHRPCRALPVGLRAGSTGLRSRRRPPRFGEGRGYDPDPGATGQEFA